MLLRNSLFFSLIFSVTHCLWESNLLYAQEDPDPVKETIKEKSKSGYIIDREHSGKAFVESGKSQISGSPEAHPKAARRTWDAACEKWKNELRRNNRSNLMVSDCGLPKMQTLKTGNYIFESTGAYKIKVSSK